MRPIILLLSCFCTGLLIGQTELPGGQIEVIKDFEVRLTETKKIRMVPQPVPVDSSVRRFEYRLAAPSPSIQYLTPDIKPLAITPEKKPEAFPLFFKAGYGNPNALTGLFSYDHVQNESLYWGIDLTHLSANNKKIPLQKFADTRGRINTGYIVGDHMLLEGYFDAHFEKHYFYGADPIPANPESLKRLYNRYDLYLKVSGINTTGSRFRYNGFLQYLFDKDNFSSREQGLRIGGELGSSLGQNEYPVGIKVLADLSTLKHTSTSAVNNFIAEPYVQYDLGDLSVYLAGRALLHQTQNQILPGIEVRYDLSNPMLTLRAGWDGLVHKNNFHQLSAYNPYIFTRLDSINNQVSRRWHAGVSGTSGGLTFDISGEYTRFTGMAFFLQDPFESVQFTPVYDDGSYVGLTGTVKYEILRHMILHAGFSQRFFKLQRENKPWHVPSLGIDGQLTYHGGSDQYHVSLLMHMENGLPYRTVGGTEDRLDPLIDLSLHGDYFITPSIGAFAEINNILGNKRERWFTYPTFGFNARAGIFLRLP